MKEAFTVQVPASTSNLGSGFDTLSAALTLYLSVRVHPGTGRGIRWTLDPPLPREENILDQALRAAAKRLRISPLPALQIQVQNPIPLKRGLGSSGAAIIAGIKVAEVLSGRRLSQEEVFELAYPLEGHPDNLSASLLGGWVLSWVSDGRMRAEKLHSRLDCRFVLVVPEVTVSTRDARRILPQRYSLEDAVFNVQRAALWVHLLGEGRPELVREAVQDRLHQPYRAALVPGLEALIRTPPPPALRSHLLGLSISGSGSAVIALTKGREEEAGKWMLRTLASFGTSATFLVLGLDGRGATVRRRGGKQD